MEPERRGIGTRVADAVSGLRDGLLRDNKVLPPVLAALALVIFAWLLAGAIIGDPGDEERVARQAAQPSVAQAPDDGSSDTPAPGVENRDNESLDVYESKDPFRELIPQADAGGGDTAGDAAGGTPDDGTGSAPDDGTGSGSGSDGTGTDSGGSDGTGTGTDDTGSGGTGSSDGSGSDDSGSGTGSDSGGEDFLDQTSPGDPGFDDGSGSGSGGSGNGSGSGGGSGRGGGSGQYDGDGNGSLFDSGGARRR